MPSRVCVQCEKTYQSRSGRFCSIECHDRWWIANRTANRAPAPLRPCEVCGQQFSSHIKHKLYCSAKCIKTVKAAYREANREYIRESHRTWRTINGDQWRATALAWRQANQTPESERERKRVWAKANPDVVNAKTIRHRARKRGAQGNYTAEEFRLICKKQGGKCNDCGKKHKLTVDHIVPLVRGGTNFAYNIQGLCLHCNQCKSAKLMDYAIPSLFDRQVAS